MNYIFEYYQKIKDGSITTSNYVRQVMEYLVGGLERKDFKFDQKKASNAIGFIETFIHHSEGGNGLLQLELWQKAIVSAIFGIVEDNGLRKFREVVIITARKNGKSLFASAICNYCAYCDGEYGARIYCVAPKLDQSDIIYNDIWQSIVVEPELESITKRRKSDYYISSTNTSIKKIAFNAKKSDGFNPHLTICDEIASWSGSAGLKQYEVMTSALGARKQPLIVSISTAGYENDGIYDELMNRCTRFLKGESKEQRLLPFLYIIDDVNKWNDINELAKSNPNLGVSVSVSHLLNEISIAESSLSKKAEFLTKYCNIKQNSSQAWLDAIDIEKASGEELHIEDFTSSYCVGGIDLSRTTDLTACCVVIERDGELYVFSKFFMPREKVAELEARDKVPYSIYVKRGLLTLSGDNFVDYHDCENWYLELVNEYEILPLQIGYDRYSAQYLIQDLNGYGFHTDDVFQGNNLTPVIREFEGLIKDGKIHIGNNDLLKIHLLNTALKLETETEKCRIVKIGQSNHIDGTASLLDALCVRQKWYGELGERLQNLKG